MMSLTPFLTNHFTNHFVPSLSTGVYSIAIDEPIVYHRQPNYSLVENHQHAYLEVELPGVAKKNINLDIIGNKLVISARRFRDSQTVDEKSVENTQDGETDAKQGENPKPSVVYELKIRISHRYDAENIQASMDGNGILQMAIPIKKQESPRKIMIE